MSLSLTVLPDEYAVLRLPPEVNISSALNQNRSSQSTGFVSVTYTQDECSVVIEQKQAQQWMKEHSEKNDVSIESNWRALKVEGPLDFSLTGILYKLIEPLSVEGVSIFAISTFDTDYLMVKSDTLQTTVQVLKASGYSIING